MKLSNDLHYSNCNADNINLQKILDKDCISIGEKSAVINFLVKNECKNNNIPVPDLKILDEVGNFNKGGYFNNTLIISLFNEFGNPINISELIHITLHELHHYFSDYEARWESLL